jgi:hypothetical protein
VTIHELLSEWLADTYGGFRSILLNRHARGDIFDCELNALRFVLCQVNTLEEIMTGQRRNLEELTQLDNKVGKE